jgi:CBS domain-containing protein
MNAGVTVRELMNREYVAASESDGLVETVELLLREEEQAAVVQRGSECVGVLTAPDVLAALVEGPPPEDATVGDAMTETVPTIDPEETLDGATAAMATQSTGALVVENGGEPLGVLTERDLLTSRTFQPGESADTRELDATPQAANAVRETGPARQETDVDGVSAEEGFEDQSICEGCGSLASDLAAFNGQLLCAECRDM